MINTLADARKCEATIFITNDFGAVLDLAEKGSSEVGLVIAVPSWHTEYNGYITCPPISDHRENWLCDVIGGQAPPQATKLRKVLEDWLSTIDLSALDDNDDSAGHTAICQSLDAALATA